MQRYFIPILLILLSTGMYVYYIEGTYTLIRVAMKEEVNLDASLALVEEASAKQQQLNDQYAAFPPGSDHILKTIIPETIDSNKFVIDMDEFLREQGLVMKSPSAMVAAGQINDTPVVIHSFKFTVTAPYAAFRIFLRTLERSLALRDIGDVTFSSTASENASSPTNQKTLKAEDTPHDYQVGIVSYSLK